MYGTACYYIYLLLHRALLLRLRCLGISAAGVLFSFLESSIASLIALAPIIPPPCYPLKPSAPLALSLAPPLTTPFKPPPFPAYNCKPFALDPRTFRETEAWPIENSVPEVG